MSTFTSTNSTVRFTDTDGDVSFTASRPAVTFTAGYQSVTTNGPTDEEIRDLVAGFVTAGSNVTVTHNDAGDTLTIASTGGGGSDEVIGVAARVSTSITALGGTVSAGTVTCAALNSVPTGDLIWLIGDGADNGFYAKSATNTFTETTDYLSGTTYVGSLVVVNFDLEFNTSTAYIIRNTGAATFTDRFVVTPAELTTTLADYALTTDLSVVSDLYGPADDDIDALGSTALCLSCDGVNGWATANLGDVTNGIDFRIKVRVRRPVNYPTQQYMELLTQTNAGAWGGDNFEAAILWPDSTFSGQTAGVPYLFWEHTPNTTTYPTVDGEVGYLADIADFVPGTPGPANRGDILAADGQLAAGEWATLRWVQNFATGTVSMYREVPYEGDDTTTDGRDWKLLDSWTWAFADSIEPGITDDWYIGLRLLGDIAWFEMYDGDDGTLIDSVGPTEIAAAGVGATSVTGSQSNVFTTSTSEVGYVNPTSPVAGTDVSIDASGFNGNLTTSDDTVQEVAQKVDDLAVAGFTYTKAQPSSSLASYSNRGAYNAAASTMGLTAVNRRVFVPIYLPADTFTRIGVNVTATAASTWRLGLHTDNGGWPTAAPLADYGTIDMSGSTGRRDLTISQTVTAGWYWAQIQVNAYTATPTVTAVVSSTNYEPSQMPLGFPTDRGNVTRGKSGFYDSGGTGGALGNAPASLAAVSDTLNDVPRVWLWRA